MKLSKLKIGEIANIVGLGGVSNEFKLRMKKMGIEEGANVVVKHFGFPNRNPIAICVDEYMVALSREEAGLVKVEVI